MSDLDHRMMTEAELEELVRKAIAPRPAPKKTEPQPPAPPPSPQPAAPSSRAFRCDFCKDGTCIGACRD